VYYDKLKFSTDDGASSSLLPEFGTIDDLGFNLILKLIKGKIVKYNDYIKNMKNTNDNVFYNYYKFICENIIINDDCNFIPEFILTQDACFFKHLQSEDWKPTNFGLVKIFDPNQKIIPLVNWKKENAI
jgi:hypothetical protein